MFCPRCGQKNPDNAAFCMSCGNSMDRHNAVNDRPYSQNYHNDRMTYILSQKNAGIGIILSFIYAGMGHLYAEQIGKGLLIMIVYFVLLLFAGFLTFIEPTLVIVGFAIVIVFWVWAMYDVNKIIKEYNEYLLRTGRPPS